jgi:type IV secretory pathway VirB2 component (pilin)|nr:TrbC/VirB2 family protein [uncultured Rhodopila sp.]
MKYERIVIVALLTVLALPDLAYAQAAGGAFLNGAVNWMQTAVITSLATLAVIVLGIILMMLRFSLAHAAMICAGIWIAFNAAYLSGLLHA